MDPVKRLKCLGKTKKGTRCKNIFLTNKWSTILTCSLHWYQKVTFQYHTLTQPCRLHDVAHLIAGYISDPKTFYIFANVCISAAKACHSLQEVKKKQFRRPYLFYGMNGTALPNGTEWKP